MTNIKFALLTVGLLLSLIPMTLGVQGASVNKPTYAKGDYWNYRSTGIMSQTMDFNIVVNKTSVKVSGHDCYELVAKTNSTSYIQTTTTWERTDNLGAVKAYSVVSSMGLKMELTTTYTQGNAMEYRFPLSVGDKWTDTVGYTNNQKTTIAGVTTQTNTTVRAKVTAEAVSQESITVPAGTFNSIKVKITTNLSANITQYLWYSANIGTAVKTLETDTLGTPDPLDDQTSTMELLSYKIKPQNIGGINYGKPVSSQGEQTNFLAVTIIIIVCAVMVIGLDIMKAMKNRIGQDPGRSRSVAAQMGVRPQPPSRPSSYQDQYQQRGRAPAQRYAEQGQDDYETYGNYR